MNMVAWFKYYQHHGGYHIIDWSLDIIIARRKHKFFYERKKKKAYKRPPAPPCQTSHRVVYWQHGGWPVSTLWLAISMVNHTNGHHPFQFEFPHSHHWLLASRCLSVFPNSWIANAWLPVLQGSHTLIIDYDVAMGGLDMVDHGCSLFPSLVWIRKGKGMLGQAYGSGQFSRPKPYWTKDCGLVCFGLYDRPGWLHWALV